MHKRGLGQDVGGGGAGRFAGREIASEAAVHGEGGAALGTRSWKGRKRGGETGLWGKVGE